MSDSYLIAGKSKSFRSHRGFDAYLIKIDYNGNNVRSKTYGGIRDEDANDIINYKMGGVFVGSTKTFGNKNKSLYINRISKKGSHVWRKAYFLDGGGKRIWEHYLGGRKKDFANKIIYTGDGYLVVGKTVSYGYGDFNIYLIKLNKKANGNSTTPLVEGMMIRQTM